MSFVIGGRRARLHDDEGAVAAWGRALAKRPDYLEAGYNRALALERLGRMRDAVTAYEAVLRYHPSHHDARVRRGLALLGAGDLSAAEEAFRALASEPGTADAGLLGLARVALARGDLPTTERLLSNMEQRGGWAKQIAELRQQLEEARRAQPSARMQ